MEDESGGSDEEAEEDPAMALVRQNGQKLLELVKVSQVQQTL